MTVDSLARNWQLIAEAPDDTAAILCDVLLLFSSALTSWAKVDVFITLPSVSGKGRGLSLFYLLLFHFSSRQSIPSRSRSTSILHASAALQSSAGAVLGHTLPRSALL